MRWATLLLLGTLQVGAVAAQPAAAPHVKVALVIGNSAYKDAKLANPVNDATDMAALLEKSGFHVILRRDVDSRGMRRAVREFSDELRRAQVGLFYFAGHGVQIRGANYLIPVAADIRTEADAEDLSIDANYVLRVMEDSKVATSIVILDACRNNPFARSFRSANRGLAQMAAGTGSLVAFATAPGSVAADGQGRNGVYTANLLKNLAEPGVDVLRAFQRTRAAVVQETGGKQTPWESTSLVGDFYLHPAKARPAPTVAKGPFDGVWEANNGLWHMRVDVRNGHASGLVRCFGWKRGNWGAWGMPFKVDLPPKGQKFSVAGVPSSGWSQRYFSGVFPEVSIKAEQGVAPECADATVKLERKP
jgi:hypothetical protein